MDYDEGDGSMSADDDDVGCEGCKGVCPNLTEWYGHSHFLKSRELCPSYCHRLGDPSSEPCGNAPHPQPFPFASSTFGQI